MHRLSTEICPARRLIKHSCTGRAAWNLTRGPAADQGPFNLPPSLRAVSAVALACSRSGNMHLKFRRLKDACSVPKQLQNIMAAVLVVVANSWRWA